MASVVWGRGGITDSWQFSGGLPIGVEPEPFQPSCRSGKGKVPSRMLLFCPSAEQDYALDTHSKILWKGVLLLLLLISLLTVFNST